GQRGDPVFSESSGGPQPFSAVPCTPSPRPPPCRLPDLSPMGECPKDRCPLRGKGSKSAPPTRSRSPSPPAWPAHSHPAIAIFLRTYPLSLLQLDSADSPLYFHAVLVIIFDLKSCSLQRHPAVFCQNHQPILAVAQNAPVIFYDGVLSALDKDLHLPQNHIAGQPETVHRSLLYPLSHSQDSSSLSNTVCRPPGRLCLRKGDCSALPRSRNRGRHSESGLAA